MKKRYTRKQICEAIKHWQKQLKKMDEALGSKDIWMFVVFSTLDDGNYIQVFKTKNEAIDYFKHNYVDEDVAFGPYRDTQYTDLAGNDLTDDQAIQRMSAGNSGGAIAREFTDGRDEFHLYPMSFDDLKELTYEMTRS